MMWALVIVGALGLFVGIRQLVAERDKAREALMRIQALEEPPSKREDLGRMLDELCTLCFAISSCNHHGRTAACLMCRDSLRASANIRAQIAQLVGPERELIEERWRARRDG